MSTKTTGHFINYWRHTVIKGSGRCPLLRETFASPSHEKITNYGETFVSSPTFFENKYGFEDTSFKVPVPSLQKRCFLTVPRFSIIKCCQRSFHTRRYRVEKDAEHGKTVEVKVPDEKITILHDLPKDSKKSSSSRHSGGEHKQKRLKNEHTGEEKHGKGLLSGLYDRSGMSRGIFGMLPPSENTKSNSATDPLKQKNRHMKSSDTGNTENRLFTKTDDKTIQELQEEIEKQKEKFKDTSSRSNTSRWRWFQYAFGLGVIMYIILPSSTREKLSLNFPISIKITSSKNMIFPDLVKEKFVDVKGIDEAKEDLMDVVRFLKEPQKYTEIGAKVPHGVILEGPPGVGKTLLAKATAGEANVPFFYATGSEFEEIFVGVGAKRVRDLFETAKLHAPCIIFIDEIDSVGSKRQMGPGVHPHAHQCINQLLAELDGFEKNPGVFVIAATNRIDVLDQALLRPGRFDLQISVDLPDLKGRTELFQHYLKKVKHSNSVDIDKLARGTFGMSGADISNVVNQAAIKAAKDRSEVIDMKHIEFAKDKVMMGVEKKTRTPDEHQNQITACHEAGHTLVAHFTKHATPLYKVTIMKRGSAMGHTQFLPEKEIYNKTRQELLAELDVLMGGRVAEEIMFGSDKVTTGASSDFQSATSIAKAIVTHFGMSEKAGQRVYIGDEKHLLSPEQKALVDQEINRLLKESYKRTTTLLENHKGLLKLLADNLQTYETLTKEEVISIISGKKLKR